ncbi:MAG: hypothetical protein CMB80_29790 [Flammeovirgaceae bacterium]|nr:hypothetical protein [Flammeovirgaceae bacterium]MBE61598.1 hypothetical protein [Flammeovirgaceae bacterium]MBR10230.1 hypothetical protein [Rickettsiales bacterium]|tara:strand:- start:2911 stop:3492 length:582 start_codon:yes stop_codon:yes gene_type:complete
MKKIIVAGIVAFAAGFTANAQIDSSPVIRVYKNDLEKIYTVFFGDTLVREVSVVLEDKRGTNLIEETITGKGFSKPFGLSSLSLGDYTFVVKFDKEEYEFPITLKSEKEILEGSVTIDNNYPTLKVNVTKYNMVPTNIMVFNTKDDLLKIFYWEPTENMMTRDVDLSQFEGYEVRVQVEQNKEIKLEQLVTLY